MKRKIHQILTASKQRGDLSWWFDAFLITLILLNVVAVVVASVEPIRLEYPAFFYYFELFSVIFFTIEYILRIWTANEKKEFERPITGNLRYALTPLAIIDLLAILPFYLPLIGLDMRFVRMMRLFRLVRLFKISRYTRALTAISSVLKEKREELIIHLRIFISSVVVWGSGRKELKEY